MISNRYAGAFSAPLIILALSVPLSWAIVNRTSAALVLAAAPLAALFLVSPIARTLVVVVGTIAVFGGTGQLSAPKLAFLLAASIAFVGSLLSIRDARDLAVYKAIRPMFRASLALFFLVGVSFVVAMLNGTPIKPWVRDVSPYLLFAAAPYFAVDAARALSARRLRTLVAAAGLFASLAFAVTWFTNRGAAQLPTGWLGLPSVLLPAALIAYGTAAALRGGRRSGLWLLASVAAFALLAVTGTRSSILLLVVPFVIIAASPQHFTRRFVRLAAGVPLAGLVGAGLIILVLSVSHANIGVLKSRIELLSITGTSYDHSYISRTNESHAALSMFGASPLTGEGPGVPIQWLDSFGTVRTTPTVDSPFGFLAKFGLLGVAFLGILIGAYFALVRSIGRLHRDLAGRLALIAFGVVVLLWSILEVPFEDKGLSVGFLLLLAVSAREFADAEQASDARPAVP